VRGVRPRRPTGAAFIAGVMRPETGTCISMALVRTVDRTVSSRQDGLTVLAPQPHLRAILGGIAASLLIACFIPVVLFYVCLATSVCGRRWWRPWPGAMESASGGWRPSPAVGSASLTVAVLTAWTAFALATGNTFFYFLQPAVTDVVVAGCSSPRLSRLARSWHGWHRISFR
jgi:hypothetical protein